MITHHSAMTSSLHIKILKFDKFGDFSCDIDYNSRTDVFRDGISLIINQCDPKRLYIYIYIVLGQKYSNTTETSIQTVLK